MWSIADVKARGKEAFKANYGSTLLISLILTLIAGGVSVSTSSNGAKSMVSSTDGESMPPQMLMVLGAIAAIGGFVVLLVWVLNLLVLNPLKVGCYQFMKENLDAPANIDTIRKGFVNYGPTVLTMFLTNLFLALWTCLFIIPGVIKGYSYRLVPYLIIDEPSLSPTEVITKSRKMMDGNKWRAFVFDLSFIGWYCLSIISCGLVGVFWTGPYKNSADAALYREIRDNYTPVE